MKIKKIYLNNFRNYNEENVLFDASLNVVFGNNAQGKTNLLEAIYFCCVGKSARTKKESELVNWNSETASIKVVFERKSGEKTIEIFLNKHGKKSVKINGVNVLKIADLIGTLSCVYFSPDELKLVKEAPQDRRQFMDIDLSQLSKNYFYLLNKYNKILAERNKLLKDRLSEETLKETLPIWNEQLATVGSKLIIRRLRFLNKLKVFAEKEHLDLTNNNEKLELEYAGINLKAEEEIKAKLLQQYVNTFEKDRLLGYTTIGPHRDDIKIIVNGTDVRAYGSQGQQRTVALSLKFAELEIFKEEIGEYPILLLDDVLSELDSDRRKKLLSKSNQVQTFITTTQKINLGKNVLIENGKIIV